MAIKIVCWGPYGIPINQNANWIAQDKNGEWWSFFEKPVLTDAFWYDVSSDVAIRFACKGIEPPEPGSWKTQLYWIGD